MDDLISRQAAIDAVGANTWAGSRLAKLPSADATEVVRCKDCIYYVETDCTIGSCLLSTAGARVDGFCAWAEWREGNE